MSSESSTLNRLYSEHLERLDHWLQESLRLAQDAGCGVEGVLFHSGSEIYYHRDDRVVVFQPNAHFRRWLPAQDGPEHVVLARPGRRPVVVRVRPRDYWHDTSPFPQSHWESEVDLHEVETPEQVLAVLQSVAGGVDRVAYFGDSPARAAALGIESSRVEPNALRYPLDWYRATKTTYEVELTRVACRSAARGHLAAEREFYAGADEMEIHWAYQRASGQLEQDLPYGSIVAFDEKSAILHYQKKRRGDSVPADLLLLDAGAQHCGYTSDITRTFVGEGIHPVMRQIRDGVDAIQVDLVEWVTAGRSYVDLHLEAHRRIAELLCRLGVIRVAADQALESGLTRLFMPHGVGHQIGLQIHDVGGHQAEVTGGERLPPDGHVLRNTRVLEPGHLVTLEPGIYFIPMLLDPLREEVRASMLDWTLVDALIPLGGVRIEDDVLCTEGEPENLTRGWIEGSR